MNIFKRLISKVRILFYRLKGYKIGKKVYIGYKTKIHSDKVYISDYVFIDDNVSIKAKNLSIGKNSIIFSDVVINVKEDFVLGNRCKISRKCIFKASDIKIENDFWCNEFVEVGGGGWQKDTAKLIVGPFTHIGRNVHLNVCKNIIIKGYSGIGMDCMLFTHSFGNGQCFYEGYPISEGDITIEENVSIYSRVIITPGTYVEKGVMISANALARKRLNKNTFYSGIPAVPIKEMKEVSLVDKFIKVKDFLKSLTTDYEEEKNVLKLVLENKCIILYSLSLGKYLLEQAKLYEKQKYTIVLVYFNEDIDINDDYTHINLGKKFITGKNNKYSELLRNEFRRKGTILDMKNYEPLLLNAKSMKEQCIEL